MQVNAPYRESEYESFLEELEGCLAEIPESESVMDVSVKRAAELSTDHHLVVGTLRLSEKLPQRRSRIARIQRIKWETVEREYQEGVCQ